MLNSETARHDLATLYVGISRVTRLKDLKIWPIDCSNKRAIKHLVAIKRPGFIRVWRKGYSNEGVWKRSQLDYTKLKAVNDLLGDLHAAGDFKKASMTELRRLYGKCQIHRQNPTKLEMVKRLKQKRDALVELINTSRSPSKHGQRSHNAMASPQPKRRKRTARQRRRAGDSDTSSQPRNSGSRSRSRKRRHQARNDSPPPQSSSSRRRSNPVTSTPASRALAARPRLFA